MARGEITVVTDRGGHLHNAVMLLKQMSVRPDALVTTYGPDINALNQFPEFKGAQTCWVPYLFSWAGKTRYFNPFKMIAHIFVSFLRALRLRPKIVVSVGAGNVVFFCYWARLLGARVYHVECMNQVHTKSITGKLLYPICQKVYVQWEELLSQFGPKAQYAGWVL